jgi:hypothetical protein
MSLKYRQSDTFEVPDPGTSYQIIREFEYGSGYLVTVSVVSTIPVGAAMESLLDKPRTALMKDDLPAPAEPTTAI